MIVRVPCSYGGDNEPQFVVAGVAKRARGSEEYRQAARAAGYVILRNCNLAFIQELTYLLREYVESGSCDSPIEHQKFVKQLYGDYNQYRID